MNKIKHIFVMMLVVVILATTALPAFAYVPYNTYNYNFYGETVAAPSGYVPEDFYLSGDLKKADGTAIAPINSPNDLYVDDKYDEDESNDEIYLLDLGGVNARGRLCIFNSDFVCLEEITSFIDPENPNEPYYMKNPGGVTVDREGYIYICDTDNGCVLKVDRATKKILLKYGDPGNDVLDSSETYQPRKIVIGINGAAYVISKGCLRGILEFNPDGEFVRFFGAPKVQLSVTDYFQIYWRKIYRSFIGADADKIFVTFVPTEFENMDIDAKGFIFTTVIANETSTNEISKLNFTGTNVLSPTTKSTKKVSEDLSSNYGDLQTRGTGADKLDNNFVDIVVDDDGFFSILDTKLCKIFEYDAEGNLIFVYGGDGQQVGTFEKPTAMAKLGKRTLVVDALTCGITVFKHSEYGAELHSAVVDYNDGLYAKAEPQWKNILRYNANSDIAHVGIGKVYYMNGDYKNAMNEFAIANDRENYSRSFALYRKNLISKYFTVGATVLVILFVLIVLARKFVPIIIAKKKNKKGGAVNG